MAPGPILIFDKSALQSLSLNEAVWLDHFFLTNITPIFYVETLADLAKVDPTGRTADAVVSDLASKTPDRHPYPNVFHRTLLIQDLLGSPVAMTGQIPLAGGIPKRDPNGGTSIVFDDPPEAETIRRWKAGEFGEVERLYARKWRADVSGMNFDAKIEWARTLVPLDLRITSLTAAKTFADSFVSGAGREVLTFAGQFMDIPHEYWPAIEGRYNAAGRPALTQFAPYAAFVLTVDLVFYLGMGIGQISAARPSNMIDVAYIYYLPFCMVFTSGDNLHARLAPLFMRERQQFVRAQELKSGLKQLNDYYTAHRDEIDRVGLMGFAPEPPAELPTIISTLWERCLLPRGQSDTTAAARSSAPTDAELLERINRITDAEEHQPAPGWDGQPDSIILRSWQRQRRGDWQIFPKGVENTDQ